MGERAVLVVVVDERAWLRRVELVTRPTARARRARSPREGGGMAATDWLVG